MSLKHVAHYWLVLGVLALAMPGRPCQAAEKKPFIIVFDFDSEFDSGKWGKWVANNFRKKATRKRKYEILDDVTFRDVMSQMNLKYKFADPPLHFVRIGVGGFKADIIVWGKIDQAGPTAYKLYIRAMDLRKSKTALMVDDVHDCPSNKHFRLRAETSLDRLEGILSPPEPEEEVDDELWRKRPNLVKNPGFEKGDRWHPKYWEKPNGLCQFIVDRVSPTGRCLMLETNVLEEQHREWLVKFANGAPATQAPKPLPTKAPYYDTVGGLGGSHLYSDPIPVKPGMTYRFDIDFKGPKGNCKLFIKGYALIRDKETFGDQEREIYRAPGTLGHYMDGENWVHWSRTLHPTDAWVVFDFQSDFDNGKMGRKVADTIRDLATGTNRFAVVDGGLVRRKMAEKGFTIDFNQLTDEIVEFSTRQLGGMIAVWGAVIQEAGKIKLLTRAANVRKKQTRPYFDREFVIDDINKLPLACADVVKGLDRGTPVVKYLRIKIDAYWPQGTYYFDNVALTEEGIYDHASAAPRSGRQATQRDGHIVEP